MPKRGKRKGGRRFRDRYEEVEFKTKPPKKGTDFREGERVNNEYYQGRSPSSVVGLPLKHNKH